MKFMPAKGSMWFVIFLLCQSADAFAPSLSIVNSFQEPKGAGIHIVDLQSGKVRFIAGFYDWKLSPDGRYVVGGKPLGNTKDYGVFVTPISGNKSRQLLKVPTTEPYHPNFVWSPDSSRVSVKDGDGKNETFIVSTKRSTSAKPTRNSASKSVGFRLSKSTHQLLKKRFHKILVAFSPDGKWVAAEMSKGFYQDLNYTGGIFLFRPDGSRLMQITKNVPFDKKDADDREIVWLPDGKRILFRRTSYEDEGI